MGWELWERVIGVFGNGDCFLCLEGRENVNGEVGLQVFVFLYDLLIKLCFLHFRLPSLASLLDLQSVLLVGNDDLVSR